MSVRFFLYRFGDHRDLHSFPTRRSSDLFAVICVIGIVVPANAGAQRLCFARHGPAADTADHRSEEHTSELQSHSDLVCRLLLEKKKRTASSTACTPYTDGVSSEC